MGLVVNILLRHVDTVDKIDTSTRLRFVALKL
jgi:hypothetical protein